MCRVKRAKEKKTKRAKTIKQLNSMGRRHLLGVRVVMKNMVYVTGMKIPGSGDEVSCFQRQNQAAPSRTQYRAQLCLEKDETDPRQSPHFGPTTTSANTERSPSCTCGIAIRRPPSRHLMTTLRLEYTLCTCGGKMPHELYSPWTEYLHHKDQLGKCYERVSERPDTVMRF